MYASGKMCKNMTLSQQFLNFSTNALCAVIVDLRIIPTTTPDGVLLFWPLTTSEKVAYGSTNHYLIVSRDPLCMLNM